VTLQRRNDDVLGAGDVLGIIRGLYGRIKLFELYTKMISSTTADRHDRGKIKAAQQ
jgi:hypothetical protein